MIRQILIPLYALGIMLTLLTAPALALALAEVPQTIQRPVTSTLHGTELVDPYRWLEGDEQGEITDEVAAWTDQQNAHTR